MTRSAGSSAFHVEGALPDTVGTTVGGGGANVWVHVGALSYRGSDYYDVTEAVFGVVNGQPRDLSPPPAASPSQVARGYDHLQLTNSFFSVDYHIDVLLQPGGS